MIMLQLVESILAIRMMVDCLEVFGLMKMLMQIVTLILAKMERLKLIKGHTQFEGMFRMRQYLVNVL